MVSKTVVVFVGVRDFRDYYTPLPGSDASRFCCFFSGDPVWGTDRCRVDPFDLVDGVPPPSPLWLSGSPRAWCWLYTWLFFGGVVTGEGGDWCSVVDSPWSCCGVVVVVFMAGSPGLLVSDGVWCFALERGIPANPGGLGWGLVVSKKG